MQMILLGQEGGRNRTSLTRNSRPVVLRSPQSSPEISRTTLSCTIPACEPAYACACVRPATLLAVSIGSIGRVSSHMANRAIRRLSARRNRMVPSLDEHSYNPRYDRKDSICHSALTQRLERSVADRFEQVLKYHSGDIVGSREKRPSDQGRAKHVQRPVPEARHREQ